VTPRENITDPELLALADRILEDTGFDIRQYKDRPLKRRLAVRLRNCKLQSYREYADLLRADPQEYPRLFDALTINVTKFYRNPETYQAVADRVLPKITDGWDQKAPLQFWSAGCSSGEEPYSLAVMWIEFKRKRGLTGQAQVHATDIDRLCLEKAQAGAYEWGSLDEMPRDLVDRHFSKDGAIYSISTEARKLVKFQRAELLEPAPFRQVDMILCRNVLIYFNRASQEIVFKHFLQSLKPGGFLVLGKVETMIGQAKESFAAFDTKERIYQRTR
jgi:chemotaxis methyl-accepting protein methylase